MMRLGFSFQGSLPLLPTLFLLTISPVTAQIEFKGVPSQDFLSIVRAGVLEDLDEDGHLDFVGIRLGLGLQSDLFSRLGTGDGEFGPAVLLYSGSGTELLADDFNGDGHVDLVLGDPMILLLGDGAGGFSASSISSDSTFFSTFLAGDFNLDTHLDLAVVDVRVRVYLGDGFGDFSPALTVGLGGERSGGAAAGDFDGDGILDLVAITQENCGPHSCDTVKLIQLIGQGQGSFVATELDLSGSLPTGLAAADFDQDSIDDLILRTLDGIDRNLCLVRGTANGLGSLEPLITGFFGGRILAEDVDGDGDQDLIMSDTYYLGFWSDQAAVMLGDGGGGFEPPFAISRGVGVIGVGEFTQDSVPDLFLASDNSYSIHEGFGDGSFERVVGYVPEIAPFKLVFGDFNEDGVPDLATGSSGASPNGLFSVAVGDGVGELSFLSTVPNQGSNYVVPSTAADFDEDGHLDLVAKETSQSNLILFGDGSGAFPDSAVTPAPTGSVTRAFLTGDFNEDGHQDLVQVFDFQVRFFPGDGVGGFDSPTNTATLHNSEIAYAVVDMNGDGHLDLAGVVGSGIPVQFKYEILLGDGEGGLAAPQFSTMADGVASAPAVGDFNSDGNMDLAVPHRTGGILVLLGNGDGSVAAPQRMHDSMKVRSLAAADFDSDGGLDLAGSGDRDELVFFLGDGGGGFSFGPRYRVGAGPSALVALDFDLDGDVDVAVGNTATRDLVLLLNQTSLPEHRSRLGSVNVAVGPPVDVLFVNQSAGVGLERRVTLSVGDSMAMEMFSPPSNVQGPARLVLWAWAGVPTRNTVQKLPAGLGLVGMPTPLSPERSPQPRKVSNSFGHSVLLGSDNWPFGSGLLAPVIMGEVGSLSRTVTFYLQGLIEDTAGPNGEVALTNGIEVVVE